MSEPHPSRAREADVAGTTERDGVRLAYRVYGDGPVTVVLMPTWTIIDSRFWKAQVAYLARHYRVVTFDGRGSGGSDRPWGRRRTPTRSTPPTRSPSWTPPATERAVLVALSCASSWAVHVAAAHPERVAGLFVLSPSCGVNVGSPGASSSPSTSGTPPRRAGPSTTGTTGSRAATTTSSTSSSARCSPSRTRPSRSRTASGGPTTSPRSTLVDATAGRLGCDGTVCSPIEPVCRRCAARSWSCTAPTTGSAPTLVGRAAGRAHRRVADAARGCGPRTDGPPPGRVNLLIREFVDGLRPPVMPPTWTPAAQRPQRALYLSSPIGLGHARRDLAIAEELKALHPGAGDRLAGPAPGHHGAGGGRGAGPPRLGAGWPTSRRTSSTRPASTTCTRSRRSGGWTRSWSTTSWCSRTWSSRSTTTSSSVTRPGTSTTSCTRTPS